MKKKIYSIGILAVLALSAVAFAAEGFSVAQKPKEGDSRKFAMRGEIDLGGTLVQVKANISEKVTKVEADGTFTVESNQTDGKVTLNGSENDMPDGTPTTIVFRSNGEISKIPGDAATATANAYRMGNLTMMHDAGKAVNVGDTWTADIKADAATGAVAGKAEYKLLGEEKVGTFDTLKIKVNVKESTGDAPGSVDGTYWINKVDGSMVKSDVKWINVPLPGNSGIGPLTGSMKLDRI